MNISDDTHYTPIAKLLHWLIAGMIVVQFTLAQLAENTSSEVRELALLANHKSVGITILFVAILRIAWRLLNKPPGLPAGVPGWQVRASQISHWSLYALLLVLPMTGWLMSSAAENSVSWFNVFQLPDFVAPDAERAEIFEEIHETLAKVLFAIALVHIVAALKHHFIEKNDILRRMTSPVGLAVFIAVLALGAAWLARAATGPIAP